MTPVLSVQLLLALAALVCWVFAQGTTPRVSLHVPVLLLIIIVLIGLIPIR